MTNEHEFDGAMRELTTEELGRVAGGNTGFPRPLPFPFPPNPSPTFPPPVDD